MRNLAALVVFLLGGTLSSGQEAKVLFEKDIVPIFKERCLRCHGEGRVRGGLDLRRRSALLEGGDSGPAIVLGRPEKSLLVEKIHKGEMPPAKKEALTAAQQATIRRWVEQGALLAGKEEAPLPKGTEVGRFGPEERDFWSFKPARRPQVPAVQHRDQVRNPIDAFVLAKLEKKGLSLAPEAPRQVLLRRLCFDLLGLPPTPEQYRAFLNDQSSDAYEQLVERLLASPHYGERWGRHWLDLAGYADSDGYLAADRLRPEAWRYRDYVINAMNDDLPYDRFLMEQLAGDEMDAWREAERLTPVMTRRLVATGFLRTASDPTYPGYAEPNEIHQVLGDTLQIVGSAFLGMTLQCARCHDHKLEPLSQKDYYAFQGLFLPALDPQRWQPSGTRGIRAAPDREWADIQAHNRQVDEKIKPLAARLAQMKKDKKAAAPKEKVDALQAEIAALEKDKKAVPPLLRGLTDLDGTCPETRVLRRGDHDKPGAVVEPGFPEVLVPAGSRPEFRGGKRTTGRRSALARWLADPAHPLTARLQVNRMWAQHFGRGLVPTVANFGRSGAAPSHPELLDWLACEFTNPAQGTAWSMKALHRLMVTSAAYRQGADHDPARLAADPDNVLLSRYRPRRLEGEAVRDAMLAVSGKLNEKRFGPPAAVVARGDGSVETKDDAEGNRRSIYLIVRRSQHLTLLDLFDTPMMEINCPQRNVSTVPLQALAMLHGPFPQRNAVSLAERLLKAPSDEEGIDLAFRLAFTREPRPQEKRTVRDFLQAVEQEALGKDTTPARRAAARREAWTQFALVLFNSNEFLYVP